jgi:MFS family permease
MKHKIDYQGAAALVIAVIPFLLALSWGGVEYPWASPIIIGMLVFSAVMAVVFYTIEKHASEPIIPLELFSNKIVAISMVVIFLTGFAMFGGIIFIPLLFQGVQGLSATASGSFLTPMMLGMVFASFISGQSLSRNGRYRMLGIIGLVIMAIGAALLWKMDIDTSYASAVAIIVVAGFGLGITMPLYTIVVQNAVPYKIMGVATSSTAFFRSIGASFGLAIMGSIMTNRFVAEFMDRIPPVIKTFVPEERLLALANNPQVLVSPEAQQQLKDMLSILGPQGQALYDQIFQAMRVSLSSSLSEVFFIGMIVTIIALVFHFFVKEIPLRKYHVTSEEQDGNKSSQ